MLPNLLKGHVAEKQKHKHATLNQEAERTMESVNDVLANMANNHMSQLLVTQINTVV